MNTTRPAPYPAFDGSQVCAQTDSELFFPEKGSQGEEPKALCRSCPFLDPCRNYALTHSVEGIWGGTSIKTRQTLRARLGIIPVPLIVEPATNPRKAAA